MIRKHARYEAVIVEFSCYLTYAILAHSIEKFPVLALVGRLDEEEEEENVCSTHY